MAPVDEAVLTVLRVAAAGCHVERAQQLPVVGEDLAFRRVDRVVARFHLLGQPAVGLVELVALEVKVAAAR